MTSSIATPRNSLIPFRNSQTMLSYSAPHIRGPIHRYDGVRERERSPDWKCNADWDWYTSEIP